MNYCLFKMGFGFREEKAKILGLGSRPLSLTVLFAECLRCVCSAWAA